jgi:hypothetical protein
MLFAVVFNVIAVMAAFDVANVVLFFKVFLLFSWLLLLLLMLLLLLLMSL